MLTTNEQKICNALGITEADFRRQQRGDQLSLHSRGTGKIGIMLDALRRVAAAASEDEETFVASLRDARTAIDRLLSEGSTQGGVTTLMVAGRPMVKFPGARK